MKARDILGAPFDIKNELQRTDLILYEVTLMIK
jgi:hypothetical protein